MIEHVTETTHGFKYFSIRSDFAQLLPEIADGSIQGFGIQTGVIVSTPQRFGTCLAGADITGVLVKMKEQPKLSGG